MGEIVIDSIESLMDPSSDQIFFLYGNTEVKSKDLNSPNKGAPRIQDV